MARFAQYEIAGGMGLHIMVVCLFIALFTLWSFIVTGTYARRHRLLPLLLAVVGVTGFYEIVKLATRDQTTMHVLEDMMAIQMLYILWCYVMDYHDIKVRFYFSVPSLGLLLLGDVLLYLSIPDSPRYYHALIGTESVFFFLILGTVIYAWKRYRYSKQEYRVSTALLIGMTVPMMIVLIQDYYNLEHGVLMMVSMTIGPVILSYFIWTGELVDSSFVLNEQLYRDADVAMLFFDPDNFLLTANEKSEELFPGLKAGQHMYVREAAEQDKIRNFIMSKPVGENFEYRNRTFLMKTQEIYFKGVLRTTYRGKIYFIYDITDNLRELEVAKDQAKLKAQFLARASHDLRSPLHAIIGVSEMLGQKKEISRKNRHLIEHIHSSGNSLLKIVNSILDYSKIEAGALELNPEVYQIADVVQELAQVCIVNLQSKRVDFAIEIATEFPHTIIGDRLRVTEMMQNILSNSVKFTEEGRIHGRLAFTEVDGRWRMDFEVEDTGGGMSEEQLANLFEEYKSYANQRKAEGTGLGMSILKEFSHMMEGDVFAESDGVTGSRIGFYIYQEKDEETLLSPEIFDVYSLVAMKNSGEASVSPTYVYPEAHVLLADDMEINRQIFERMTADWMFCLDKVENGLQAVELVKQNEYDLIVLDFMMPVMGGDEAVVEIRKLTDTPVMLLSANVFDGNMDQFKQMGFNEILAKPLNMKQIKAALEDYLPEELRKDAPVKANSMEAGEKELEAQKRTYDSFKNELKNAIEVIKDLYQEDKEGYRIRVHGIKGAARQVGYDDLATASEIQEMASKAQHYTFIENHIDEYVDSLKDALEEVRQEEEEINHRLEKYRELSRANVDTEEPKENLYERLGDALDGYDAVEAEEVIKTLEAYELSEEEKSMLYKVSRLVNDFEYEEAVECLRGSGLLS